jgi:hypothetical protein
MDLGRCRVERKDSKIRPVASSEDAVRHC